MYTSSDFPLFWVPLIIVFMCFFWISVNKLNLNLNFTDNKKLSILSKKLSEILMCTWVFEQPSCANGHGPCTALQSPTTGSWWSDNWNMQNRKELIYIMVMNWVECNLVCNHTCDFRPNCTIRSSITTLVQPFWNHRIQSVPAIFYCPRRDFAQKAKSRGGTLVTRAYINESTYSWNTQSYSQYRKNLDLLGQGPRGIGR